MSATKALIQHNESYAAGFDKGDLPKPPRLKLAIVTCMDARIETGAALGLAEGDAHVLRNAGAVVTEDVVRSLMISQHLLGTREVWLIPHTDCGMLKLPEAEVRASIETETGAGLPFSLGAFDDLEAELQRGVTTLRENPLLPHRDAIHGFIFDVESGRLRPLG